MKFTLFNKKEPDVKQVVAETPAQPKKERGTPYLEFYHKLHKKHKNQH